MTSSPERKRAIGRYVLRRLSPQTCSDVLADGAVAAELGIGVAQRINIASDLSLDKQALFSAFQQAADGLSRPPLKNLLGDGADVDVALDSAGTGIVSTKDARYRLEWAALSSSSRVGRVAALDQNQQTHTICERDQMRVRAIIDREPFTSADYFEVVGILVSALESQSGALAQTLRAAGRLSEEDILPGDRRYWDHLVAPIETSDTLVSFVKNELARERRQRISMDTRSALWSISLTFAAPALVPRELIRQAEMAQIADALRALIDIDDPFGLVGLFQICADRLGQHEEIEAIGARLLTRLLGDPERLRRACQVFAATFILTSVHLAGDQELGPKPAFWRRLAAASHSSLVVRTLGVPAEDQGDLVDRVVAGSWRRYLLSALNDFVTEPRWRPEWIEEKFLLGDVIGRVRQIVGSAGELPSAWTEPVDRAWQWLEEQDAPPLFWAYPALLESTRRGIALECPAEALKLYHELHRNPSLENFLATWTPVQVWELPSNVSGDAIAAVRLLRAASESLDDARVRDVLTLAAHVSTQTHDLALADVVADAVLEKAGPAREWSSAAEAVLRLLECSTANPDRLAGRTWLAHRFEALAFVLEIPEMSLELLSLLEDLRRVAPEHARYLGRAIAAARLGAYRPVETLLASNP